MTPKLQELAVHLAESVAQLKASLQHPLLSDLEAVLAKAQASLDAVNDWPGGSEGLQAAMEALDPAEKAHIEGLLSQARQDQAVNAQLLTLAMQRNAALQAEAARTAEAATYSSDGGFQMGDSGRLLGKF